MAPKKALRWDAFGGLAPELGRCRTTRAFASLCLLLAAAAVAVADDSGYLGFAVKVEAEGFFLNPTLKSATVDSVSAGSPAARAGLVANDRILDVDDHAVVGAKARELEPLLKKAPGQSLRLKLRRPNGEEYDATLEAALRSIIL